MRRLVILFWLSCLGPPPSQSASISCSALDPVDSLELRLFLEDSVFVEWQPVQVFAVATNRGSRVLPAVTRPTYLCGHFAFALENLDTGKPVPRSFHACGFLTGGWDLPSGASLVDRTDLLTHFGGFRVRELPWLRTGLGGSRLPPGRYRLAASYPARVPHDRKNRRFTIKTSWLEFRVEPLDRVPADAILADAFDRETAASDSAGPDLRKRCLRWLPRVYSSRLFEPVHRLARIRLPRPPLDSLVHDLECLRGQPFRRVVVAEIALHLARGVGTDSIMAAVEPYLSETPGPELLSSYRLGPPVTIRPSLDDLDRLLGEGTKKSKGKKRRP